MKPIILATAATLLVLFLATVLFRLRLTDSRARALVSIYVVVLALLVAVTLSTPANLGFLPERLPMGTDWFDLLSGAFFYSAAFFGGVLQLYNLADRGFSLRILIDLLERPDCNTTAALYSNYSDGKGIRWMYQKRVVGMIESNLVTANACVLKITARGKNVAVVYQGIRRLLRIDS